MEGQIITNSTPWERSFRYDAPVIGLAILALIAGWVMKSTLENQRTAFLDPEGVFFIEYPSSWTQTDQKGFLFSFQNLRAEGRVKPGIWMEGQAPPSQAGLTIQSLVTPLTIERGRALLGYRVMGVTDVLLEGRSAMQVEYFYVDMPSGSATGSSFPVVMRAVDTLFLHGEMLYIITYAAPEMSFPDQEPIFKAILESLELGS